MFELIAIAVVLLFLLRWLTPWLVSFFGMIIAVMIDHWQITLTVLFIMWIVGALNGGESHHHYCDTCLNGEWNRGSCYCKEKETHIIDIESMAGCSKWISRR